MKRSTSEKRATSGGTAAPWCEPGPSSIALPRVLLRDAAIGSDSAQGRAASPAQDRTCAATVVGARIPLVQGHASLLGSVILQPCERIRWHRIRVERPYLIRYWPRLFSWDDRSSARVQRVFAIREGVSVSDVARGAHPALVERGWYRVTPSDLDGTGDVQVIVWQRDPDERLDLEPLWPLPGMTREQWLYGGIFPAEFLDAPRVIG